MSLFCGLFGCSTNDGTVERRTDAPSAAKYTNKYPQTTIRTNNTNSSPITKSFSPSPSPSNLGSPSKAPASSSSSVRPLPFSKSMAHPKHKHPEKHKNYLTESQHQRPKVSPNELLSMGDDFKTRYKVPPPVFRASGFCASSSSAGESATVIIDASNNVMATTAFQMLLDSATRMMSGTLQGSDLILNNKQQNSENLDRYENPLSEMLCAGNDVFGASQARDSCGGAHVKPTNDRFATDHFSAGKQRLDRSNSLPTSGLSPRRPSQTSTLPMESSPNEQTQIICTFGRGIGRDMRGVKRSTSPNKSVSFADSSHHKRSHCSKKSAYKTPSLPSPFSSQMLLGDELFGAQSSGGMKLIDCVSPFYGIHCEASMSLNPSSPHFSNPNLQSFDYPTSKGCLATFSQIQSPSYTLAPPSRGNVVQITHQEKSKEESCRAIGFIKSGIYSVDESTVINPEAEGDAFGIPYVESNGSATATELRSECAEILHDEKNRDAAVAAADSFFDKNVT